MQGIMEACERVKKRGERGRVKKEAGKEAGMERKSER
jgi:hypothetical protein